MVNSEKLEKHIEIIIESIEIKSIEIADKYLYMENTEMHTNEREALLEEIKILEKQLEEIELEKQAKIIASSM